ncbi:NAD(P)H-hydrate epimerase [Oerskovia sp. M15]
MLLVGSGNNGGDALYAGAHLARRGSRCTRCARASARTRTGSRLCDGRRAGRRPHGHRSAGPVVARGGGILGADVVLDGLVGIGATGALRGVAGDLVQVLAGELAQSSGPGARRPWVIAVDVPSGIGVDDGSVPGPVLPADRTVTFGATKPGLLLPPATHLAGVARSSTWGWAS